MELRSATYWMISSVLSSGLVYMQWLGMRSAVVGMILAVCEQKLMSVECCYVRHRYTMHIGNS